jgi:hypothetical protein
MQLRTLVFGMVLASAGFAAGRVARSAPEAPVCAVKVDAPVAPVVVQLEPPAAVADEPTNADVPNDDPDTDGVDVAELIAHAETRALEERRWRNTIVGQVIDAASGVALPGCTVVVSSPALQGVQTAITDQNGNFQINDLPAASYLVTYYYNDITVERSGVSVSGLDVTRVSQRLDQSPPPPVYTNDEYIANIPVPRTFTAIVGEEGESFSSNDTIENTYVIDGDATNLEIPQ